VASLAGLLTVLEELRQETTQPKRHPFIYSI